MLIFDELILYNQYRT